MNTKIRFIEVFFMLLLIAAFGTTGFCIMRGYHDYAMISLVATSFITLVEFYLVLTGNTGKVIDLRGATNRGRAYGTKVLNQQAGTYEDDFYNLDYSDYSGVDDRSGFSSEGVGNMRVYQRGEKIEYADSDDE